MWIWPYASVKKSICTQTTHKNNYQLVIDYKDKGSVRGKGGTKERRGKGNTGKDKKGEGKREGVQREREVDRGNGEEMGEGKRYELEAIILHT